MENCDSMSLVRHTPIFKTLGNKKSYYKNQKFIEYLIIEHNDKQKLLEGKLIEMSSKCFKKVDRDEFINNITYLLVYYTNEIVLDLWYYFVPDAFQIFFDMEDYINITYNSKNLKNLYYLIDRHGGSLWERFNTNTNTNIRLDTLANYDIETFKKIILKDKITDYNINNIPQIFLKIKNIDVIEIICEQYKKIDNNVSHREDFLKIALINNHKALIKHFFEKENEMETIPINILYYVLYPRFYEIDRPYYDTLYIDSLFYNKFYTVKQLSDNLNYVYQKLSNHYGKQPVLDYIINSYDYDLHANLITSVIRFHCINIIKDIEAIKGSDFLKNIISGYDNSIVCDLMRYGQYEVLTYVFDKYESVIFKSNYKNILIDLACYNTDDRVLKFIIKKIEANDYRYITLNFLSVIKLSDKKKIQKLRIICNNFDLTQREKDKIMINAESKEPSMKLFFWLIAKFYNNIITNDIPNLEKFLRQIILSNRPNILDKFIKLCSVDFNCWEIFNVFIYYYYQIKEPEKILNKIYFKLDNIKKYPWSEEKILYSIEYSQSYISYNNNDSSLFYKKVTQFDKNLKMLKNSGFNLNKKCFGYQKLNILDKINNTEIFKIAIINGISFPEYFRDSINKYDFFSPHSMISKYRSLYKLIKRIEIRREIKNRKLHRRTFYDTQVCINHRPPTNNIPVLKKGGEEFYKMNRCMISDMSWEEDFVNAKHIEPLELLKIAKNEILVTPKIDGVTAKNIDMDNVYPPIPEQFKECVFDGEYIEELDIYLVFGIRNSENNLNCPYDDFMELRNEHQHTKNINNNFIITNTDFTNLNLKISNEFKAIKNYIELNKGRTLWWPKALWRIFDKDIILDVLHTLQLVQKSQTLYSGIKTDGYIINIPYNKKDIYKLKPTEHMTIDLRYDGKWKDGQGNCYDIICADNIKYGIYRCYFDNGKWEARDYRPEKKHPNPKNIVDIVQEFHKNPWTIDELKKYQEPVYYQHFEDNKQLKPFNMIKNNWFRQNIYDGMKILDIGCGYLNGRIWNNPSLEIDGLDNDISIIKRYDDLSIKSNKNVFIQDFTKKWDLTDDYIKRKFNVGLCNKLYDIILMNFSIHYSFNMKDGFSNLMTEINKRSISGKTKLMISFIDSDILFKDRNQIDFEDGGFFKNTDSIIYGKGGTMTYYYPWRSNKINNEKIFGHCDIKSRLYDYGWYEKIKYTTDYEISTMGYKELNKSIKRVTFMKK